MRRVAFSCAPWLLAWAVAGCGTAANLNHGVLIMNFPKEGYPRPYGGVALHMEGAIENAGRFTSKPLIAASGVLFQLVDLPLTLVGDTVTLPWILTHQEQDGSKARSLPTGIEPADDLAPPAPAATKRF